MVTGRPDILRQLIETGRTGWYLQVLRPGTVPVAGPLTVVDRTPHTLTILEVHREFTGS